MKTVKVLTGWSESHLTIAVAQLVELKQAGQRWVDSLNACRSGAFTVKMLDENTAATKNLEAVCRRILGES